jgi:hypothetical protein
VKRQEQRQREQDEIKAVHQKSLEKLKDKHKDNVENHEIPMTKSSPPVITCGCFGIRHRPLINCLVCGRIVCELEGISDCIFCGNSIKEVGKLNEEVSQDAAWKQKELMVQFDREFARRTVVYDEQADYFSNSTSSWLTGKEREEETKKDEVKRKELHRREMIMKLTL